MIHGAKPISVEWEVTVVRFRKHFLAINNASVGDLGDQRHIVCSPNHAVDVQNLIN